MNIDDDDDVFGRELHFAAQDGSLQRVRELQAKGHDINAFGEIGKTPLHHAVESERFEVAARVVRGPGGSCDEKDRPLCWPFVMRI
jgi:hypothetical protein